MNDMHLITARRLQREFQRVRHVRRPHVCAEFPRDDVATVIVEDRAEMGAQHAPAQNLDVGEVCLQKLVDRGCFVFELVRRLEHDEGGTGDQIMGLERAIYCGFQYKIALLIPERHRQFTGR